MRSQSSSGWFDIGVTTAEGDTLFINKNYITHVSDGNKKNVVKVWVKTKYRKFEPGNGTTYSDGEEKMLWEFDCASGMEALLKDIKYSQSGEVIQSSDFDKKWEDPIPETIAEALLRVICAKRSQGK